MDELLRDFIAETREGLEALDSELVRFEQNPESPDLLADIFRLIHTIKGASGFLGLGRLQAVAHAGETVLGGFRDGSTPVTPDGVSAVLEAVDVIRHIVDQLEATAIEPAGDDQDLIVRLELAANGDHADTAIEVAATQPTSSRPLLERLGGEATLDAACEMALLDLANRPWAATFAQAEPERLQGAVRAALVAAARGFGDRAHLLSALEGLLRAPTPDADVDGLLDAIWSAARLLESPDDALVELADLVGRPTDDQSEAPAAQATASTAPSSPPPTAAMPTLVEVEPSATQTIRVGVDALEHLMTVASELVLIRNQLLQLLRFEPESPFAGPLHRLNQVTSELQEGVMTTRMQPISGAWAKLPRLVRDLARDLGKKIDLQLHGQDTELDRQVLELIKDPLTHMIRNAADHGLETPAERLAEGKPEVGNISLSARHEGGAIVIEMSDDGRGLSAAKIRAKAISCSLVTPQQAEAMTDAEARRLIFMPGFSTAAEVTAVSGRGVGMDVVRTNVERIGGVIEVASTEGEGSCFVIRIPLTLTIVSALIIECCGERFAMPQSSVVELVSASDGSGRKIEYVDGSAVLRLRDRLLPLVPLQGLLGMPVADIRQGETCIVVARVGSSTFGVIVDRVFDTEEIVVKPVASVLRHLKVYSGATILGDGSVILILDFKGLSPDMVTDGNAELFEFDVPDQVEQQATLVFRAGQALRAAPLSAVSRIEEITADQVEVADGRTVQQYRGKLMPVIEANGQSMSTEAGIGTRPLLVFSRGDRSLGVVVDEIVDIVETGIVVDLAAAGPETLGSLIIEGRATDMIDVDYYWRCADGGAVGAPAPTAAIAPVSAKRLLLVDKSPFCQLLLRPLLAQAGYEVTVAEDPEAALSLHNGGAGFDLIMADTSVRGGEARRFAESFARAERWHATPLLGLGLHKVGGGVFDETTLLAAVSDAVAPGVDELRGAA